MAEVFLVSEHENPPQKETWQTICVTLDSGFVKRMNLFCYENDLARSAVVEYALTQLFGEKDDPALKLLAKRISSKGFDRVSRRNRYVKKERK